MPSKPAPKKPKSGQPLKAILRIRGHQGLHARPAAVFVQVANRFKCKICVRKGRHQVDGKSIMGLLTLAAEKGCRLEIIADGPDAQEALEALQYLLAQAELPNVVTVIRHHRSHDSSAS